MMPGITAHIVVDTDVYRNTILADIPHVFYEMDTYILTPGFSRITYDSSGNGYIGNCSDYLELDPPLTIAGTSMNFGAADPPSGWHEVGSVDNDMRIFGDMTIECWVNMRGFSTPSPGDVYIVNQARFPAQGFGINADYNIMYSLTVDGSGTLGTHHQIGVRSDVFTQSVHSITTNTIHHLVIVRDTAAKTITYYDNGVEYDTVGYGTNPVNGSETVLSIGHIQQLSYATFNGHIDNFALYVYKLTAGQILSHYNAGIGL